MLEKWVFLSKKSQFCFGILSNIVLKIRQFVFIESIWILPENLYFSSKHVCVCIEIYNFSWKSHTVCAIYQLYLDLWLFGSDFLTINIQVHWFNSFTSLKFKTQTNYILDHNFMDVEMNSLGHGSKASN